MRKYLPIAVSILIIASAGYVVISKKNNNSTMDIQNRGQMKEFGEFRVQKTCARPPEFLKKSKISQPVIIDLSQKKYKGIAFLYGKGFQKVLHPLRWERYEYFSTYTVDELGNIYLVPMPFISIRPTTFNLQKNIYRLDTITGKLNIFMNMEDIHPSANNPYGLNAITYDCDDHTLWAAAIDESDYRDQKGVIYHIDPKTKEVLQRFTGVDVLSMNILRSSQGKFMLIGSARDNALYAYPIKDQKIQASSIRLLELPDANEHIRKIKISKSNTLELQSIQFTYALIAQTGKKDRVFYNAAYDHQNNKWRLEKKN